MTVHRPGETQGGAASSTADAAFQVVEVDALLLAVPVSVEDVLDGVEDLVKKPGVGAHLGR
jgi:hypothetical protein